MITRHFLRCYGRALTVKRVGDFEPFNEALFRTGFGADGGLGARSVLEAAMSGCEVMCHEVQAAMSVIEMMVSVAEHAASVIEMMMSVVERRCPSSR